MNYLDWKLEFAALTEKEEIESLTLAESYEFFSVERLKYLSQLALLRQVSIDALMKQLGVNQWTMIRSIIPPALREAVIFRALKCCGYCKSQDKYSPSPFTIDHVFLESLDGSSDFDNLAYACFLCNRLKSNKLKVFDESAQKWTALFNPRKDKWKDHFSWNGDATLVLGITFVGRCTIQTLKLNREKLIEYRNCIIPFGAHPPYD